MTAGGGMSRIGYGKYYSNGKGCAGHCVAYEYANGPIPDGLVSHHLRRVHSCVNASHLKAVTM